MPGTGRAGLPAQGEPPAPPVGTWGCLLLFGEEELVSAQDAAPQQDRGCPRAAATEQRGALHGAGSTLGRLFGLTQPKSESSQFPPFTQKKANEQSATKQGSFRAKFLTSEQTKAFHAR